MITIDPNIAALAVSKMGRKRTAPASRMASRRDKPRSWLKWMKSMRMIELRTTIPARAIIPIMAVAVKNVGVA